MGEASVERVIDKLNANGFKLFSPNFRHYSITECSLSFVVADYANVLSLIGKQYDGELAQSLHTFLKSIVPKSNDTSTVKGNGFQSHNSGVLSSRSKVAQKKLVYEKSSEI